VAFRGKPLPRNHTMFMQPLPTNRERLLPMLVELIGFEREFGSDLRSKPSDRHSIDELVRLDRELGFDLRVTWALIFSPCFRLVLSGDYIDIPRDREEVIALAAEGKEFDPQKTWDGIIRQVRELRRAVQAELDNPGSSIVTPTWNIETKTLAYGAKAKSLRKDALSVSEVFDWFHNANWSRNIKIQ
jgi:hypothetical protein